MSILPFPFKDSNAYIPLEKYIEIIDEFLPQMPKSPFEFHRMIMNKYPHETNLAIHNNAVSIQDYFSKELKLADNVLNAYTVGYCIQLNNDGIQAQKCGTIAKYNKHLNDKEFWDKVKDFPTKHWYILVIAGAIWWGIQTYVFPKPKDEKSTPIIENTTPIKMPIEEKHNENQPLQSEQKKNSLIPDSVSLKTMKKDS